MIDNALKGSRRYWTLIAVLAAFVGIGIIFYIQQWNYGLGITGMSRDVSWGLYIANFTFMVGVAASAVMVVLPYYLHNFKEFSKITILGEFLAVSAVLMAVAFILVDLGQPTRAFNLFLYATPTSLIFWDTVVLSGYLLLNLIIAWSTLDAERKEEPPLRWIRSLIIISIPWAISIHTVTAFIYSGLVAKPFWLTALLAPRFLASAFASGPALLILLSLIIRRFTSFDPGRAALQKVGQIVTYAMIINVFFLLVELFTVFYSQVPEHHGLMNFIYLFFGLDGKTGLVPWMWISITLSVISLVLLINPATRRREGLLAIACVAVFGSIWIEKGIGLIVAGFIPATTGAISEYIPTVPEALITIGVWAGGFLLLTVFYKVVVSVRQKLASEKAKA